MNLRRQAAVAVLSCRIETVQYILIKLDMKPRMHSGNKPFLLNNVTIRPTKIINRADKNWAHFSR